MTKVLISLVNWYTWEDCVKCIESIKGLEAADCSLETRIIDNNSPNNSFEELSKHLPNIQIIQTSENLGFAGGHELNVKYALENNFDYIWILNTDLTVDKKSLSALIDSAKEKSNSLLGSVSMKSPTIIDFAGCEFQPGNNSLTYNVWGDRSYAEFLNQYRKDMHVQTLEGSSLLIPIEIIKQYGFLPTDYFMYGEESDYCLRLLAKGVKSYIVTGSKVFHKNEGTTSHNDKLQIIPAYYRRRNFLLLNKKYFNWSSRKILGYPNGILPNLKSVIKNQFSKNKDTNYYYALASFHAALGVKGKKLDPNDLIE